MKMIIQVQKANGRDYREQLDVQSKKSGLSNLILPTYSVDRTDSPKSP